MRPLRTTIVLILIFVVPWAVWLRFGYWLRGGVASKLEARARSGAGTHIPLYEVADFSWERVVFLGPYSNQQMAKTALGFEWPGYSQFGLERSDFFSLLVFADAEHVVRAEKISRCLPDFDEPLIGTAVPRAEATFQIVERNGCFVLVRMATKRSNSAFNTDAPRTARRLTHR